MPDSGRSMREDAFMFGRSMGRADYEDGEPFNLHGPFRIPGPNHAAYSAGYKEGWDEVAGRPAPTTSGRLLWVLEMESSEIGIERGQFAQSWAGYEGERLRLRIQTYRNGRIVVYPFSRDESSTDIVWELEAPKTYKYPYHDSDKVE